MVEDISQNKDQI